MATDKLDVEFTSVWLLMLKLPERSVQFAPSELLFPRLKLSLNCPVGGVVTAVTVPVTLKLNGPSSASLFASAIAPLNVPAALVFSPSVIVVEAPGASVVCPGPETIEYFVGRTNWDKVRLAVPSLRIVSVFVLVPPTTTLGKFTVL